MPTTVARVRPAPHRLAALILAGLGASACDVGFEPLIADSPSFAVSVRGVHQERLSTEVRVHHAGSTGAPEVTVAELLEDFTRYFLHWINRWAEEGFAPIARQWSIRADGIGEEIELDVGKRRVRGTFVEIDQQGRLILSVPDEGERKISVNEHFALDGQ